jgi:ABC-2 type transport system ATP-binding protein
VTPYASDGPALETRDLRVTFSGRHSSVEALKGVDLTAERGQITTILGTNGAGKSTLLRVLQGLQQPTSGTAFVLGDDVRQSSAEHRARVGVMLQEGGLPPAARPGEFLRHVARFYAAPLPVAQLASSLGIDEFAGTAIRRLSGGQRQRVALAAAVVGRPDLVMLDEPSAGLDPVSRVMVTEFIERLRDEGTSVILTTHLLDDAERLSDYVHILSRGIVRQSGTLDELASSSDGQTLAFAVLPEARPAVDAWCAAALADGLRVELDEAPHRLQVHAHGAVTTHHVATAAACGPAGAPPLSLSLTQANLTDIFFQTTQEEA